MDKSKAERIYFQVGKILELKKSPIVSSVSFEIIGLDVKFKVNGEPFINDDSDIYVTEKYNKGSKDLILSQLSGEFDQRLNDLIYDMREKIEQYIKGIEKGIEMTQ